MRWDDLVSEAGINQFHQNYPNTLQFSNQTLRVDYRFEAGAKDDGVTITVPQEVLGQLHEDQLGWLVPGLLKEKLVAMIRTLPKDLRRKLVPAPDAAREAASRMTFGHGRFLPTVAHALSEVAGVAIAPELLRTELLPEHLQANVRVVDEEGKSIAEGRDLMQIRAELAPAEFPVGEAVHDPRWHQDNLRSWDFGDLPEHVEIRRGTYTWTAYPYLLDQGDSVALRLATSAAPAIAQTRRGIRRLFVLAHNSELASQIDWMPELDRLKRLAKPLCRHATFREQLKELIADRALSISSLPPPLHDVPSSPPPLGWGRGPGGGGERTDQTTNPLPRTPDEFTQLCDRARVRIPVAVQEALEVIAPLLEAYEAASTELRRSRPVLPAASAHDIDRQLADLLTDGFLVQTPHQWLAHVPRYLRGVSLRIEKIRSGHAARDLRALEELVRHTGRLDAYHDRMGEDADADDLVVQYRWMLEEFRVSLFAQELGTSLKVSSLRLDRQWEEVGV
jgi:ATP-dependent helicase HrpA